MTAKADIAKAKSELDKMARFAKAFEDASAVVDLLANQDQVATETEARRDAAAAELARLKGEQDKAKAALEKTEQHAMKAVADARAEAQDIRDKAKAAAKKATDAADKKALEAEAKCALEEARLQSLQADRKDAEKELADLTKRIDEARATARKLLAVE